MISADDALQQLKDGNARYMQDDLAPTAFGSQARRDELSGGQAPFAVILGCSDSRAPAELIFDQGLGDLFVVRVAGNVICPEVMGSIEFACSKFGTRLVLVMGHTGCGAVTATVDCINDPDMELTPSLETIIGDIRPNIEDMVTRRDELGLDRPSLLKQAELANVAASVNELKGGSKLLKHLMTFEGLQVHGSVYDLATGSVEFTPVS